MNSIREYFYLSSGYGAGICIILIMLIILAQIVGRMLGFIVPSAEDFSGYCLAAATFLGLAYTFRTGGHIRVTLLIHRLPEKAARLAEALVLLLALGLTSFMSFYSIHLIWESYVFNDVSYGYIPIPLWIPQIPLGVGCVALNIAVLDDFIGMLRGRDPSYLAHEDELKLEES
ncbi:MAG TPA: TRAP transporter small permease [Marinobacterium sp.]|nr:TRAP transporter small permease [Marinobacterium sp.]